MISFSVGMDSNLVRLQVAGCRLQSRWPGYCTLDLFDLHLDGTLSLPELNRGGYPYGAHDHGII
jgi:hypothetical protein